MKLYVIILYVISICVNVAKCMDSTKYVLNTMNTKDSTYLNDERNFQEYLLLPDEKWTPPLINFVINSTYCDDNGTPCNTSDDLICVNMTIYETGTFGIGWKNCNNGADVNIIDYYMTSGQSITICLSRSTAISTNCTGGAQALFWVGRRFGNYNADDVFVTIPASCSSGSTPSSPSVTNNSGCAGSNVTLSANCSSGTPQWYTSSSGGSAFTTGSSYTSYYGSSGSYTYYVSCKNASGCESARVPVTATVNSIPSAPATSGGSRCGSGTVFLSAGGCSGTLYWYASSSGGAAITSGSSYSPFLSSTTTYYVECQYNGCTSSRTPVTGTINSIPSAPSVTGASRCGTGSVTLSASCGSGTVYWYNSSSVFVGSGTSYITPSLSSSTTYYAECNTGTCASSWSSVVATINSIPVVNAGADQAQCNNGSFSLSGSPGGGWWGLISGSGSVSGSSVSGVTVGTSSTFRYTYSNGVCSNTDDVIVTNNALPTTSNAGADKTNCNNGNFTMTANTPSVGTGTWSVVSGTATITTSSSATTSVFNVPVGTSATLRWTITTVSCGSSSDDVILNNNPLPTINSTNALSICSDIALNYTITSATVGTTFIWSRAAVVGISNVAVSGQVASTITEALINTTTSSINVTYLITPTANGCSGATFNLVVTVVSPPNAGLGTSVSMCKSELSSTTDLYSLLTGEQIGGAWSAIAAFPTGMTAAIINAKITSGVLEIKGFPIGTYTLQYTVIGTSPCPNDTENVTVTINACCPPTMCASMATKRQ